jgi:hypothetical protein
MSFVLATSIVACWAFADKNHPIVGTHSNRRSLRAGIVVVPGTQHSQSKRAAQTGNQKRYCNLFTEPRPVAGHGRPSPEEADVLTLARRHRLGVMMGSTLNWPEATTPRSPRLIKSSVLPAWRSLWRSSSMATWPKAACVVNTWHGGTTTNQP